jgi:cytochrome c biogenesis protein
MKALLNFFTSVRVGITLLIILICASIIGTLIPQGRAAGEYLVRYGQLATLLERLQFTKLYHSLWFIALLALFALNIIICTLERLFPKFRRTFRPKVETEPKNILAWKIKDKFKLGLTLAEARNEVKKELAHRRYRLKKETEADKKYFFSARKRILGLFGSDVVHLGILVILAGGIISGVSSVRRDLTMTENQTLPVPGAGFSIRLDKFVTEYYPDRSVKAWKSFLTVIDPEKPPFQKAIEVNHPLNHRGYVFYQSGYGWDWENPWLEIWVKKKEDPAYLKKVRVKVGEKTALEGEGLELRALQFIPDFVLGENNEPTTRSMDPNNPAALIEGWQGSEKIFSGWVFAKFPDFSRLHSGAKETSLSLELKDVQSPSYSVIHVAKDPGVSFIWIGCALLMTGLFLAFYWPTRELKIILEDSQGKTEVTAGGMATKSRESFQIEFASIINSIRKRQ